MNMFNPKTSLAESKGIDLPIMYWYLAGFMSGEKLKECMAWRKDIRKHFKEYEKSGFGVTKYLAFPFAFLDPFNGKEFESIDGKGLTSNIPANAIFDGDYLSVKTAHGIIANLDDFFLDFLKEFNTRPATLKKAYEAINFLINKITGKRDMIGTYFEICWAYDQKKPVVLIVPKNKLEIAMKHPFLQRASQIVSSVEELKKNYVLETFYKRMAGAIY